MLNCINKTKWVVVLLFLCSSLQAKTKDKAVLTQAAADFKKVNEMYKNLGSFSYDTHYMVFSEHGSQNPIESKNGKYVKCNNNYYTKIDDIETYIINDKIISFNPEEKLITVGDNHVEEVNPIIFNVDSILSSCKEVRVENINQNERKYILILGNSDDTEFERIDVHIDVKNNRYLRVVLFYSMEVNLKADFYAEQTKPRLEIYYKNFKKIQTDPLIFKESLYVIDDKGKLKPAPKFYNYQVTDLRVKNYFKNVK